MPAERAARGGGPKPRPKAGAEGRGNLPEDLRAGYERVVRAFLREFDALDKRISTKEGRRYTDDNGVQHINPLVGLRDKAADGYHKTLKDFERLGPQGENGEVVRLEDAAKKLKRIQAERRKQRK